MKVLVAMGTCSKFEYAEEPVIKSILSQTFKDFDLLIVDNSDDLLYNIKLINKYPQATIIHVKRPQYFRDAVGQVRKLIKDYAINNGYDYLFGLDADMLLEKDTLEKMISHKLGFVTAVIGYMHDPKNRTTIYVRHPDKNKIGKLPGQPALAALLYSDMENLPKIIEIISSGLACYMIKVSLLIGMDYFISHKEMAFLEDRVFCRDLAVKAKLYCDTTITPKHLHVMMPERNMRSNV